MTLLLNNSLKGAPGWLSGLRRHVDQWIRVECPDMDHQLYVQKIFDKAEQITQWKKTASSINGAGKIGELCMEE